MSTLDEFGRDLERATAEAGVLIGRALRKSGYDLVRTAKQFAVVDTGAMRSSIGVDFTTDGEGAGIVNSQGQSMVAEIGPTVEYAPYVEFGTSRQAPRAFMGPAFDRIAPEFSAAVDAALDATLRDL